MAEYSLICCVVDVGHASKTLKSAKKYGVKGGTICIGRGTVRNRLLKFLEFDEIRKEIITMIVESGLASNAIKGISKDMEFHKPNHGIAFSHPVCEFIGSKNILPGNSDYKEVNSGMYKIIYAIVEKGKAEDVIDAATKAGARGGTIINARGAGPHEVQKLFTIEVEPEKEKVFIITKAEMKSAIVESIRAHLKIDEPGTGILYVLDVDEVYGLHKDDS